MSPRSTIVDSILALLVTCTFGLAALSPAAADPPRNLERTPCELLELQRPEPNVSLPAGGPDVLSWNAPRYPENAKARLQGTVDVEAIVGPGGRVLSAKAGHRHPRSLASASEASACLWRFQPSNDPLRLITLRFTFSIYGYCEPLPPTKVLEPYHLKIWGPSPTRVSYSLSMDSEGRSFCTSHEFPCTPPPPDFEP